MHIYILERLLLNKRRLFERGRLFDNLRVYAYIKTPTSINYFV